MGNYIKSGGLYQGLKILMIFVLGGVFVDFINFLLVFRYLPY